MCSGEIKCMMESEGKILLLLTGGTICSFGDEQGNRRDVDIQKAKALLLQYFEESDSPCAHQKFEVVTILNTLSENMTIPKWNELLRFFKKCDFSQYRGIVIAHGTDTLAYTASLLALALSKVEIPVFLVSSQLPLNQEGANGNENFRRSVELICAGIHSGVYVVYRNEDGRCFLHHGGHLVSSGDYSNDFYSRDAVCLGEVSKVMEGECSKAAMHLNQWTEELKRDKICSQRNGNGIDLSRMGELKSDVLCIEPYVGLNYQQIVLNKEIRAVIHGLYHSATACIGGTNEEQKSEYSMLPFLMRCREARIPVIVTPCPNEAAYASGVWMMEAGAVPVYGMTKEMVYVKTLLAGVLGYPNEKLCSFLKEDVCGE
jgi:L-asparaginase